MATYLQLFNFQNDSNLQDKIVVAVVVAAETIRTDGSPPSNQAAKLEWARLAMANPKTEALRMLWAVLAVNKDATSEQINNATDAAIQAQVDAAVDLFAGS